MSKLTNCPCGHTAKLRAYQFRGLWHVWVQCVGSCCWAGPTAYKKLKAEAVRWAKSAWEDQFRK